MLRAQPRQRRLRLTYFWLIVGLVVLGIPWWVGAFKILSWWVG